MKRAIGWAISFGLLWAILAAFDVSEHTRELLAAVLFALSLVHELERIAEAVEALERRLPQPEPWREFELPVAPKKPRPPDVILPGD